MNEQRIFNAARQLDEQCRSDFLDKACGLDADLRNRIEALLAAHAFPDSLLNCPADDLPSTEAESSRLTAQALPAETQIGNYKLLQRIGEGGMGSVYMAEQLQPVRRVVALKVVKAGLDSKQVVARFEAERQTLALNIPPRRPLLGKIDVGAIGSSYSFTSD